MNDLWNVSSTLLHPTITLVPPCSENFPKHGGNEVDERMTQWAMAHHYWRIKGVERCPHGLLYGMPTCPAHCRVDALLDHPDLWFREPADNEPPELFLLHHDYVDEVPEENHRLARAHGLRVESWPDLDGWYSPGSALPIRMTADCSLTVWPILPTLLAMTALMPARWGAV